jgi:hypothetical protein
MLVRSDGSVLNREQVLKDLRAGGLRFQSIDLQDAEVRLCGSAAILTGESTTVSSRDERSSGNERSSRSEEETRAHFRFVAVYRQEEDGIRLTHFQSTSLP